MIKDYNEITIPHLLNLLNALLFPMGLIANIVIYSSADKKLKKQLKYTINWEISITIYTLLIVFFYIRQYFEFNVMYLLPLFWMMNLLFSVYGMVISTQNKIFKYPFSIPFLR